MIFALCFSTRMPCTEQILSNSTVAVHSLLNELQLLMQDNVISLLFYFFSQILLVSCVTCTVLNVSDFKMRMTKIPTLKKIIAQWRGRSMLITVIYFQHLSWKNAMDKRSLVGYSPQGPKELERLKQLSTAQVWFLFFKFF